MRILVTGAAGYLGSVLTPMLLQAGHEVEAYDNLMYGQASLLDSIGHKNLTFHRADVRDEKNLDAAISRNDIVVWLAAIVGAPACAVDPQLAYEVNYYGMILDSKTLKSKIVIYPNTNSGYGIGGERACVETDTLNPLSDYGKSKCFAEEQVRESWPNHVVFRFATLFGASPRMRRDLIVNDFVFRAMDENNIVVYEPHFRRNFLHVRDAANAILRAIDGAIPAGVYNCGDDRANMTKLELCEKIKAHIPSWGIIIGTNKSDPDKRDYLVSNEKLMTTGWRPQFSLDDGIRELMTAWQILHKRREYSNV